MPLFEVSADPSTHPKLHLLLQQVVGFDCVDDESKTEVRLPTPDESVLPPEQWTAGNPHYAYYCYYLYANLYVLNHLRRAQNLSTFCFRPHAGEAGELNHLHATFLTARGINHGINLRKSPSLQYLYYLCQARHPLLPLPNAQQFHHSCARQHLNTSAHAQTCTAAHCLLTSTSLALVLVPSPANLSLPSSLCARSDPHLVGIIFPHYD